MSSPHRRQSRRQRRRISSYSPAEPFDLGSGGLSLSPRLKLLLTLFRPDLAVKPVDEWRIRLALLSFLRSPPLSISFHEGSDDLSIRRRPDLHKRKRHEPVAHGSLCIRDLSFLNSPGGHDDDDETAATRRFLEWRSSVVERLEGIELNIEGVKFTLSVEIPRSDDFERMRKSWEDFYASQVLDGRIASRGMARIPGTIIVGGVPSRWFAEPRVSSKPSTLVTHTIFSVFGKIRNLNVAAHDDPGNKGELEGEILSGLRCKISVQFENYDDFCNAMKALCGRSMCKEGSQLKVDYEVDWDKDGFFRVVHERRARNYTIGGVGKMQVLTEQSRNGAPQPHSTLFSANHVSVRAKRFRE